MSHEIINMTVGTNKNTKGTIDHEHTCCIPACIYFECARCVWVEHLSRVCHWTGILERNESDADPTLLNKFFKWTCFEDPPKLSLPESSMEVLEKKTHHASQLCVSISRGLMDCPFIAAISELQNASCGCLKSASTRSHLVYEFLVDLVKTALCKRHLSITCVNSHPFGCMFG